MTIFNRIVANKNGISKIRRFNTNRNGRGKKEASYEELAAKIDEIHKTLAKKNEKEQLPSYKLLQYLGAAGLISFGFEVIKGGISIRIASKDKSKEEMKQLILDLESVETKKQFKEIVVQFHEEWQRPWWRRMFYRRETMKTEKPAGLVDEQREKSKVDHIEEMAKHI